MIDRVERSEWVHSSVPGALTPASNKHKLRAHKKSRGGCRNCKLRSIKCDESRPHCKRCQSYGVRCNFIDGVPEMQLAALGAVHIIEPKCHALSAAKYDSTPHKEAVLLARFQDSVAMTISLGKRLALFQNEIVTLTDNYPSLKHTIISLTLMHERHRHISARPGNLGRKSIPSLSEHEIGHWYLATSCFNNDLNQALTDAIYRQPDIQKQAALCATSALLVALTFCYVEATTPEKAWPLLGGTAPSTPEDLQWIRMSNGKLSAQVLMTGLARDPIFHPLVLIDEQDKQSAPFYTTTVAIIDYEYLLELKQFTCGPEVERFMQIANSNNFVTIIFTFWSFVGGMTAEFEYGLKYKQPASLMVLLYWYAKLNPLPVWWLKARTTLEGQAICTYLDRYHGDDPMLKRLLRWPASVLLGTF